MVKASAYGSGSVQVAKALSDQHVDYFGVAYTDEGIALRKGGITQPIMIMNTQLLDLALLIEHNLSPAVHNIQMLKGYIQGIEQLGTSNRISIHIEINSGMNRLGFDEEEINELIQLVSATPNLLIQGIFSHLAAADNRELDAFSEGQIACFNRSALQIEQALDIHTSKHILNSAGITRFSKAQFDMVRLGIGLYGFDFNQQLNSALLPVLTLKSTIAQIRSVKAGQSIGYDRAHITTTDRRIAIVSIGYADGLLRQFSMVVPMCLLETNPLRLLGIFVWICALLM